MLDFSTKAIISAVCGLAVAGAGVTTALSHAGNPMAGAATTLATDSGITGPGDKQRELLDGKPIPLSAGSKAEKQSQLPGGVSTGTSFWDPATASGKPMSYHTLASPYWPLGTIVKITYGQKSALGIVEDFGPAEWAVAQHNPPAIVDLSEKMMQDLTGTRSNSVTLKFQVLKFGDGPVYRHGGTGYDMATGVSSK